MPSARMPKTVCVASNRAMPSHIAISQNHCGFSVVLWFMSIHCASYVRRGRRGAEMQPIDGNLQQAVWLLAHLRRNTCRHDDETHNHPACIGSSNLCRSLPVSRASVDSSSIHQRERDEVPGKLSRMGLSHHWL